MDVRKIVRVAAIVALLLIGVSVVVPAGPAVFWSTFYGEIKDWGATLGPTLAIIVGAWIGFRGVRETQRANAALARAQFAAEIEREARRRRNTARDLARAFAAELRAGAAILRGNVKTANDEANKGEKLTVELLSVMRPAPVELFRAQLPSIALIGELASETITHYEAIQTVRQFDEDLLRQIKLDGLEREWVDDFPEKRGGKHARNADALAERLEAYEPPDD